MAKSKKNALNDEFMTGREAPGRKSSLIFHNPIEYK